MIEKKDQIGGHAETYVNAKANAIANIGVVVFENTKTVQKYFDRLGVDSSINNPLQTDTQIKQYDSPVTAIATYSDTDIVACSSSKVYFLHYDTETSRCVLCMFMSWAAQLTVYLDSRKHAILSCIVRVFALRQHRRTYTSRPNVTRHSRFN